MAAPGRRRRARASRRDRVLRTALPGLGVAALALSASAVVAGAGEPQTPARASLSEAVAAAPAVPIPGPAVSRSTDVRPPLDPEASRAPVASTKFATARAKVRVAPRRDAVVVGRLEEGERIRVTGRARGAYAEVVHDRVRRWVGAEQLADRKPRPEKKKADEPVERGLSSAPCASGSGVEAGLAATTIAVHRAVCAAFPQITTYGGARADGMHGQGLALDVMVSSDLGTEVAEYVRAHAAELGVTEVIWRQRIWTTERGGEGWRPMEDRGSATANHMDHVHVTTGG